MSKKTKTKTRKVSCKDTIAERKKVLNQPNLNVNPKTSVERLNEKLGLGINFWRSVQREST
jgi:hypothetical protein